MTKYTLQVNGRAYQVEAEPDMPLLWALRDLLQLTGTKYGCGIGVCGACTVHEDGRAARSCQIAISNTAGRKYTSIEGLGANGDHPCQRAWIEEDVSQCGYCQAGMVMEAAVLLVESRIQVMPISMPPYRNTYAAVVLISASAKPFTAPQPR